MPLPDRKKKINVVRSPIWSVAPPLAEAQNMGVSIGKVKPWIPSPLCPVCFYCRVVCLWITWLEAQ